MLKGASLKHQTVRTDTAAGEKRGLFYFLAKGVAILVGNIGVNVVFLGLTDWRVFYLR